MRKPTLALLAALLVLAPALASPDEAPADVVPAPLRSAPEAPMSAAEALATMRAVRDVRDLPALTAAMAAGRGAATVTQTAASDDLVRLGLTAGDLDADGHDDALVWTREPDRLVFGVEARRGADGALFWRREYRDDLTAAPLGTSDLDADGHDDVLVGTLTLDSERTTERCLVACVIDHVSTFRWGIEMLSGADGSSAWRNEYAGRLHVVVVDGFLAGTYVYDATNLVVAALAPAPGAPAGRPLVVDRFDVEERAMYALVNSTGEVVSGVDGHVLHARTHGGLPDVAFLYPAGDATGDGVPDHAWEVSSTTEVPGGCHLPHWGLPCTKPTETTLALVDGATFGTRWTHARGETGPAVGYPAYADLTGDGRDDLFLLELGPSSWQMRTEVLSGLDGAAPWASPVEGLGLPAGDVDGDGLADVLLVEDVGPGYADGFAFSRASGATGRLLFRTEPQVGPPTAQVTGAGLGGDHDGDGVRDVIVNSLVTHASGYTSATRIESGATGDAILDLVVPGIHVTVPTGDVDADGAADAFRVTLDFGAPSGFAYDLSALSLPSGATLWTRHESFASLPGLYLRSAGDLLGDGGRDALWTVIERDGARVSGRVEALDGATGTAAWTVGARP